jgi:hypothetical protein
MIHHCCFSADSSGELMKKIRNCTDFHPTLGIIFSSVALDIPHLSKIQPGLAFPVFGCSTSGEILKDGQEYPVLDQSAVCCLLDIDPGFFSVGLFEIDDHSLTDLGRRIGTWGMDAFAQPAFIITIAGLKNDGEAIIRGIESVTPAGTRIYGGFAADDGNFRETYAFSGSGYTVNGAAVLVFDRGLVEVDGLATSGWTGVGAEMIVTASEGNIVRAINNRPPVELFREYLNVQDEELQNIGVSFPLIVQKPDGSEILRTFLYADFKSGSLTFAGGIPEGSTVRFSSSSGYEVIERAVRDIRDWHASHSGADLIIIFSCHARYHAAGTRVADEIKAAANLWDAPLIGFFCYGEIGHNSSGTCDLYNETLSLVRIRII